MVEAHRFFRKQAHEWLLLNGVEAIGARAAAIETVVRDLLQMVVIDLSADENAQEIFETLNARGAQLTAADLIKNFIFQRLLESEADVEGAYQRYWKEFETGFWEVEISLGRLRYPRSSIFLNHWLIARTGEEVVAREVFSRFKSFADFDFGSPMTELLQQVHRAAFVYRQFIVAASSHARPIDRLGLFGYRTSVLESEVIKPLVLYLLDPQEPKIPDAQLNRVLDVVESWMVRRMLVRATTKSYSQVISDLVTQLRKSERMRAGDLVEEYFAGQTSGAAYWPDDDEVRRELRSLLAYRRLRRGRLRMVLEAFEDYYRGWRAGNNGLGGERVVRGKYAIEHVMPRKWSMHWSSPGGTQGEAERDRLIHTIGNLTLLTGRLNSKVSNAPWLGANGKRQGLEAHDVLLLNRELLRKVKDAWTDEGIRARSDEMARIAVEIWPAPEGHRSGFSDEKARPRHKVELIDLINAGLLEPGMSLFARHQKFSDRIATLLPDGRIDVDGTVFESPSRAAGFITGKVTNGWWYLLVDQTSRRSLRAVRRDYIDSLAGDVEDDEDEDSEDEE